MRRNRWFNRPLGLAVQGSCFSALLAFSTSIAAAEPGATPAETAAPTEPTPPATPKAAALEGPIAVVVELEGYELDPVRVRLAVARELGVAVSSSPDQARGEVRVIARKGSELSVVYRSASGAELMRSVAAPTRDDEVPEAAALLAGNLARDEASPLIASLTPEEKPKQPPPKQEAPKAAPKAAPELPHYAVNLSLFHPLTLVPDADQKRFAVEFGLFYSRVGAIDALSINALVLQVEGPANGLQFAGIASLNGAGGQGFRATSIFGYQEGDFQGAALSGLVLASKGDDRGLEAAGAVVYHRGDMLGATYAGAVAVNDGAFQGVHMAGASSVVLGDVQGIQAAGAVNFAHAVDGAQLSPINFGRDVTGAQIGIVNIGGRVNGAQIGIVNVAEDIDGASVGVVTYSKQGRVQPFLWGSTTSPANVGVRFYTGPLFAMPMIGFDMVPDPSKSGGGDVATFSPGFSIGARIPIARAFVDLEGNYSNPAPEFRFEENTIDLRYRIWAGFEVTPWFAPMVGGGVHHHFRTQGDREERFDPELALGVQFF